jgi:hypothetical protein
MGCRGVKRLELVLEGGVKRVADSRLLVPMQATDVADSPRGIRHNTECRDRENGRSADVDVRQFVRP